MHWTTALVLAGFSLDAALGTAKAQA